MNCARHGVLASTDIPAHQPRARDELATMLIIHREPIRSTILSVYRSPTKFASILRMRFLADPSSRVLDEASIGFAISALVFGWGLLSRRQTARAEVKLAAAVALSYGAFFISLPYQFLCLAVASIIVIRALWETDRNDANTQPEGRALGFYNVASVAIPIISVAGLLLYRLGSYSPTLLTWEGTTINALLERLKTDVPISQIIRESLLWTDGILSAGEKSFLFGVPAQLLSRQFGVSILILRAISVFWTLGAIIIFTLMFRRGFGTLAPCIAALVFGFNELILIYGRYGSSISATMFALTLSIFLGFRLLERGEILCSFLFSFSLFIATLGYAPARVSVLILLLTFLLCLPFVKCTRSRKFGLLVVVLTTVTSVTLLEKSNRAHTAFLRARTEQLFYMVPEQQKSPMQSEAPTATGAPLQPSRWAQYYSKASSLIPEITGPQLLKLLNPFSVDQRSKFPFGDDPPYLKVFAPALFPFMLTGFWLVWRRGRRHIALMCLTLVGLGIIPLLLTNRVDSFRAVFLTIPLSVWITVGIAELLEAAKLLRIPRYVGYSGLALGLVCGIAPRLHDFYSPSQIAQIQTDELFQAFKSVKGPLRAVLTMDQKVESMARIELFKRSKETGMVSEFWEDNLSGRLINEAIDSSPDAYEQTLNFLNSNGALVIAPSFRYRVLAAKLSHLGYVIRAVGTPSSSVFVLSRPDVAVALPVAKETLSLPLVSLEPLATAGKFEHHSAVDLTSLEPSNIQYDFAAPQVDRTYSGRPVGWRNLRFRHFLGTHATTTLDYLVPSGAEGFQSWIGISPGVAPCTKSSAQVVISNQEGKRLYESPVLRATADPVFVSIKLESTSRLRILINNAGDNRDCDHVDFGDPAFMIPKK